ncbi:hypothetical protein [Citrobacter phage Tr1]|nr:hypothetical protein [Citrobacter phage Tr1]
MIHDKVEQIRRLDKESATLKAEVIAELAALGIKATFEGEEQILQTVKKTDWKDLRVGDIVHVNLRDEAFVGQATVHLLEDSDYHGHLPFYIQYYDNEGDRTGAWIDTTQDYWQYVS